MEEITQYFYKKQKMKDFFTDKNCEKGHACDKIPRVWKNEIRIKTNGDKGLSKAE